MGCGAHTPRPGEAEARSAGGWEVGEGEQSLETDQDLSVGERTAKQVGRGVLLFWDLDPRGFLSYLQI